MFEAEAKASRPRPRPKFRGRGRGRGQIFEAKAEAKILASRPFWSRVIVREYFFTFFSKSQETRLFTFFWSVISKNVKNVIQGFTFLHFEIANWHVFEYDYVSLEYDLRNIGKKSLNVMSGHTHEALADH